MTPGTWSQCTKVGGTIVSDCDCKHHLPCREHYSGHVVAETVSETDIPVLIHAPQLFEFLKAFVAYANKDMVNPLPFDDYEEQVIAANDLLRAIRSAGEQC